MERNLFWYLFFSSMYEFPEAVQNQVLQFLFVLLCAGKIIIIELLVVIQNYSQIAP